MALSMISKTGEDLFYFRPDLDDMTLDEKISNKSDKINKLLDDAISNKDDSVHLGNEIYEYSGDCEKKGFRNGFAAGIRFIMQAMAKEV